jgi:hypothetical protein
MGMHPGLLTKTLLVLLCVTGAAWAQNSATGLTCSPAPVGRTHLFPTGGALRFEIRELIEHPFYAWPRTLLTYPVDFSAASARADQLTLVNLETGRAEPFQLSGAQVEDGRLRFAHVHFFSDLPSGATRRFELKLGGRATPQPQPGAKLEARREGQSVVLDTGVTRVRVPASAKGDARRLWTPTPRVGAMGPDQLGEVQVRIHQPRLPRRDVRDRAEQSGPGALHPVAFVVPASAGRR